MRSGRQSETKQNTEGINSGSGNTTSNAKVNSEDKRK